MQKNGVKLYFYINYINKNYIEKLQLDPGLKR